VTTVEFRKTANKILLDYMDKLNIVCLSTETGNAVAYLIDGLAIHMDLESLQKAPTAGEWHKRFTESVTSLREVSNKLLDKMRKFNE